jgi:hypothetical protein
MTNEEFDAYFSSLSAEELYGDDPLINGGSTELPKFSPPDGKWREAKYDEKVKKEKEYRDATVNIEVTRASESKSKGWFC